MINLALSTSRDVCFLLMFVLELAVKHPFCIEWPRWILSFKQKSLKMQIPKFPSLCPFLSRHVVLCKANLCVFAMFEVFVQLPRNSRASRVQILIFVFCGHKLLRACLKDHAQGPAPICEQLYEQEAAMTAPLPSFPWKALTPD